jgi:hypothetical protein
MASIENAERGRKRRRRSSAEWVAYFQENRMGLMSVAWNDTQRLTDDERATIAASVRQFQIGESSEGNHLRKQARAYARNSGDGDYVVALNLFIQEEQRHAADLGRFMHLEHILWAKRDSVDGVFRFLRHMTTLEQAIMVLLTAEIIACIYYRALHDATQSHILRGICRQIIRDEAQHLRFQTDTLAKLRRRRPSLLIGLAQLGQEALFTATLPLVWLYHGKVFRAAGMSWGLYWRRCWRQFRAAGW